MTFKEWLDEMEGYGCRMERLMWEFPGINDRPQRERLLQWLEAAYDVGHEHGAKQHD